MAGSGEDLGAPDSWEVADLDESMNRLMLSSNKNNTLNPTTGVDDLPNYSKLPVAAVNVVGGRVSEDAVDQVDEFLREALQNPRERLSILRIEQDVEKFINDPTQQTLEFNQLPTSYLRLAAHRIAQHYNLHSTVISDNNLPDGSGSRIIIHKTPQAQSPQIRLANIPIAQEKSHSAIKVAIKQRPRKGSQTGNNSNLNSKGNQAKTVEERKEEYNRARARIFENIGSDENRNTGIVQGNESLYAGSSRTNKVAIIRDREVDRKDPDYDRSYDRYMQRFDPGFGFGGGGPYTIQPIYSPVVNYNTEFPQLGTAHRPQSPMGVGSPWAAAYGPPGTLDMNHYLHSSSHYPYPRHGVQFVNSHEQSNLPFTQGYQQEDEGSFGSARPR